MKLARNTKYRQNAITKSKKTREMLVNKNNKKIEELREIAGLKKNEIHKFIKWAFDVKFNKVKLRDLDKFATIPLPDVSFKQKMKYLAEQFVHLQSEDKKGDSNE